MQWIGTLASISDSGKHLPQRFFDRNALGICYNAREARRQALAGRAEEGETQ